MSETGNENPIKKRGGLLGSLFLERMWARRIILYMNLATPLILGIGLSAFGNDQSDRLLGIFLLVCFIPAIVFDCFNFQKAVGLFLKILAIGEAGLAVAFMIFSIPFSIAPEIPVAYELILTAASMAWPF
jgi:hypothetical protein